MKEFDNVENLLRYMNMGIRTDCGFETVIGQALNTFEFAKTLPGFTKDKAIIQLKAFIKELEKMELELVNQLIEEKDPTFCEICDNPITHARSDSRYCSNACRQKGYRKRRDNK